MKKNAIVRYFLVVTVFIFVTTNTVFAQTASVSVFPRQVIQGEPLLVQVDGVASSSLVKKITFDGKKVGVFMYQDKPTALVGIDLNKKPGQYKLLVDFADGLSLATIPLFICFTVSRTQASR